METPSEAPLRGLRLERSQPAALSVENITDRFMSCISWASGSGCGSLSKILYGLEPSGKHLENLWYVEFDIVVVRSRRKQGAIESQTKGSPTPLRQLFSSRMT